eukprot:gb/GECG01002386.1/.p1 GENE.gb/GECG01002386.1/~~gb/GECG01002386.1/.p1  ORF type:complete len:1013 (+),score=120.11 gb/GECG01002386.1/:1-3039(+)
MSSSDSLKPRATSLTASVTSSQSDEPSSLSVVVLGASGDLAKKKTFPALFDLFAENLLRKDVVILGYARSQKSDQELRDMIQKHGGSKLNPKKSNFSNSTNQAKLVEQFLSRCFYCSGESYGSEEGWKQAHERLTELETQVIGDEHHPARNRVFYFALPPTAYEEACKGVRSQAMSVTGWNRVVIEKPFGKDLKSSDELAATVKSQFSEDQIYRIDHYLGKEMVQNLMILRFANSVFEPLWNRHHISTVQITFKEPFGVEGRAGYFNNYGIIRDVMQNHLLQVLSLVAMEPPVSMKSEDIRDEKVKVLRSIPHINPENVVIGQYGPNAQKTRPGYTDDPEVANDSITPTFATAVLYVQNSRWYGVPFILKCGKALNERKAEIRVQFKEPPNLLFSNEPSSASNQNKVSPEFRQQIAEMTGVAEGVNADGSPYSAHNNELVMRIQPDEAIYMKVMCKMPGLTSVPVETELNLSYKARYPTRKPPEAYARLILDVIKGDQSQFVRSDELRTAWKIFTPLLYTLESSEGRKQFPPEIYPYGSRGPISSDKLVREKGYRYSGSYGGAWKRKMDPSSTQQFLESIQNEFTLQTDRLKTLMNDFLEEMDRGLAGEESSLKMIPSFVTEMPTGKETGTYWSLDMGGSNVRIAQFELKGDGEVMTKSVKKEELPDAIINGTGTQLFRYLAQTCKNAGLKDEDKLSFCFSYPVEQKSLNKGILLAWTKKMNVQGVVGEEVVSLFRSALRNEDLGNVEVVAMVNDTVGTLVSGRYSKPNCRMGVILGTGTNAAYVERKAAIPKWNGPRDGVMLINMEWGNFGSGEGGRRVLPLTEIDHSIDAESENPGKQRFEKMISGNYLGKISEIIINRLANAGALWSDEDPGPECSSIHKLEGLTSADLSRIDDDDSPHRTAVKEVLEQKGVSVCSSIDRTIVKTVCTMVTKRAARLAAVGVASTVTKMGPDGIDCSVGIDGSLFKNHPHFASWMNKALKELGVDTELFSAEDGSGIGAAVIANIQSSD